VSSSVTYLNQTIHNMEFLKSMENRNFERAEIFLKEGLVDINNQEHLNMTYLHLFVRRNIEENVKFLLEHNADANIKDLEGISPFHKALKIGDKGILKLFLEHGAEVNAKDYMGNTPLHIATTWPARDLETIKLLVKNGSNLNAKNYAEQPPLFYPVSISLLIDMGADPCALTEKHYLSLSDEIMPNIKPVIENCPFYGLVKDVVEDLAIT